MDRNQLKELINDLDKKLIQFAFQAKLNDMGNTWIYHQIKQDIEIQDKKLQPYLIQWLDNRWGDFKLY